MRRVSGALLVAVASLHAAQLAAQTDDSCPVTTADDPLAGIAIPGWYGTASLAVQFSGQAMIWPTTPADALLAGRLQWRSSGFRPGTEAYLKIEVRNLKGGPVTARISEARNAYIPSVQPGRALTREEALAMVREAEGSPENWWMLTGVDFPEPGCWEIAADYLGQKLTFVIESVPADAWKARFGP